MQNRLYTDLTPYLKSQNATIYKGDCLEVMAKLPAESVDLIFADPPYFLNMSDKWDKSRGFENDFAFHRKWIAACRRLLKPDGSIFVSGMTLSLHMCGLALHEQGYRQLSTIVWVKPDVKRYKYDRYLVSNHESIIWACKSHQSRYTFNYKLMRDWRNNHQTRMVCSHCGKTGYAETMHKPGEKLTASWLIPSTPNSEKQSGKHPTQKPLELLSRIIHMASRKGDMVLDPFCGTGTTAVAVKYGRQFIGIEREPEYLEIIKKRLEQFETAKKQNYFSSYKPYTKRSQQ